MAKVKQPNPISEGWRVYRDLVDKEIANTHMMRCEPFIKCLTHEDCHLDSFYPGKHWRKMKQRENGTWYKEP